MMQQSRANGLHVQGRCVFCTRLPEPNEIYGSNPADWDHANICPECWDKVTA